MTLSKSQYQIIETLLAEGMPITEVARKANCSLSAAKNHRVRLRDGKLRAPSFKALVIERLGSESAFRELLRSHLDNAEIAKIYGRSASAVSRAREAAGIVAPQTQRQFRGSAGLLRALCSRHDPLSQLPPNQRPADFARAR